MEHGRGDFQRLSSGQSPDSSRFEDDGELLEHTMEDNVTHILGSPSLATRPMLESNAPSWQAAVKELEDGSMLHSDTIHAVALAIRDRLTRNEPGSSKVRFLDPLWLNLDQPPPRPIQFEGDPELVLAPVHHRSRGVGHWTLVSINLAALTVDHYDSLRSETRFNNVRSTLSPTLDLKQKDNHRFTFGNKVSSSVAIFPMLVMEVEGTKANYISQGLSAAKGRRQLRCFCPCYARVTCHTTVNLPGTPTPGGSKSVRQPATFHTRRRISSHHRLVGVLWAGAHPVGVSAPIRQLEQHKFRYIHSGTHGGPDVPKTRASSKCHNAKKTEGIL